MDSRGPSAEVREDREQSNAQPPRGTHRHPHPPPQIADGSGRCHPRTFGAIRGL